MCPQYSSPGLMAGFVTIQTATVRIVCIPALQRITDRGSWYNLRGNSSQRGCRRAPKHAVPAVASSPAQTLGHEGIVVVNDSGCVWVRRILVQNMILWRLLLQPQNQILLLGFQHVGSCEGFFELFHPFATPAVKGG